MQDTQQKQEMRNNRIEHIYRLVESTSRSLDKIRDMLKNLDKDDQRKSYHDVAGITGVFDGVRMVAPDGKKYDVPANYAAKSRLVEGDTLKLVEENGSGVFKQIEKVDRKKVEGIMNKKEGKWYIISDSGTYKVSDVAADFQHAELHDEASAFIPAKGTSVTFAALDNVKKKAAPKSVDATSVTTFEKQPQKPLEHKSSSDSKSSVSVQASKTPDKRVVATKPASATSARPIPHANSVSTAQRSKPRPALRSSGAAYGKTSSKPIKKEFVEEIITPQGIKPSLDDDDLR